MDVRKVEQYSDEVWEEAEKAEDMLDFIQRQTPIGYKDCTFVAVTCKAGGEAMTAYLKYLSYVLIHKWFVFIECCKLGIPWQGIIHDISKFLPGEFIPYARFFYSNPFNPKRNKTGYCKLTDTGDKAFDFAWLLHQKRNKHHWQWWVLPEDSGGVKVFPMPLKYRKEMLADWIGAGKAQGKPDTKAWYEANKDKMQLHPETRKWIETMLGVRP